MDDLFGAFEIDAGPSSTARPIDKQPSPVEQPKRDKKKRNADGQLKDSSDVDMVEASADQQHPDTEDAQAASKRRRKESDLEKNPAATDKFETEESREVVPAAGLIPSVTTEDGASSLVLSHNIHHQVALPPNLDYTYVPLAQHEPPAEPARVYKFKLDPFQSIAIKSIERNESVLVSAHTSAGKTVVAEYAIAQCLKLRQRVIYTSPIKALSNQKYRDFLDEFGDVGLMTGDVTINPTASCLVMTTEILRSMLYRGSEIMREVAWVIFDEIHYLRDPVRGVVWEETIILLPDNVRYVFLSATIPNAFQFAEWIAKIHSQACHVVYTDFRPTPLQNYAHPCGADGIWLIVDEKGNFKERNFQQVMEKVEMRKGDDPAKLKSRGKNGQSQKGGQATGEHDKSDITRIVKMIVKRRYNPVILFSFSKKEIESLALSINRLNFNNPSESSMVEKAFNTAIERLSDEDRSLPQLRQILPLLKKGIGIHHAGLLPILKETIEILFQEGLIKVLFATETFSIGLNMPAKTVVFTAVTKWDGKKRRPLTASEYIQMSGRAGRRGLDDRGVVIMMIDEKMDPETARAIVHGQQDRLNSAFHLSYNMVLNLIRIETVSPEYMLERCFYQFQNAAAVPALEKELLDTQKMRDSMIIPDEESVRDYYNVRAQLKVYKDDMMAVIQHPDNCLSWLSPGRLINVHDPLTDTDFGWGIIVDVIKRRKRTPDQFPPQESVVVVVALSLAPGSDEEFVPSQASTAVPVGIAPSKSESEEGAVFAFVPCLLTCIKNLSAVRVFLPDDLTRKSGKDSLRKALQETLRRLSGSVPPLDPLEMMQIQDNSFKKTLRKIELLEARLFANPLHDSETLPQLYDKYAEKMKITDKIKQIKQQLEKSQNIVQLEELKARKRVLRRLGFINDLDVVQMKARVACEISSTENHELLLAELLLDGFFNDMTPEKAAAVLSCFVFEETVDSGPLKDEFAKPFGRIREQARIMAKVSMESKLDVTEEDYLKTLKPELMDAVYNWANGESFSVICKIAQNVYEGSLVRVLRRLEELLRQLGQAAKVMGSEDLVLKFEQSLLKIHRSVVATQSLYL